MHKIERAQRDKRRPATGGVLPNELWWIILSFVPPRDIAAVRRACRDLDALYRDRSLWRLLYYRFVFPRFATASEAVVARMFAMPGSEGHGSWCTEHVVRYLLLSFRPIHRKSARILGTLYGERILRTAFDHTGWPMGTRVYADPVWDIAVLSPVCWLDGVEIPPAPPTTSPPTSHTGPLWFVLHRLEPPESLVGTSSDDGDEERILRGLRDGSRRMYSVRLGSAQLLQPPLALLVTRWPAGDAPLCDPADCVPVGDVLAWRESRFMSIQKFHDARDLYLENTAPELDGFADAFFAGTVGECDKTLRAIRFALCEIYYRIARSWH